MFRMNYCDHSPFVVRPSTPLNDFSSETHGPVFFKHYSVKGVENCTTSQGPKRKMAAMAIYGKHLKLFSFRTKEALRLNLGI